MEEKKIIAVLRLINLMSGVACYTLNELAERVGVTPRTIYRYITELTDAGFVLQKNSLRQYRLASLPLQMTSLENVVFFSQEEAQLLGALIASLDTTNALRGSLCRKLSAIYDVADIEDYVVDRDRSEIISQLGRAIEGKRCVVLRDYESANSSTISDRTVEPFAFTTNFIDVFAYEPLTGLNKIFKISRMGGVQTLGSWEHEEDHRMGTFDVFRMHTFGSLTHVNIRLSLRAKNLLCEEFPLADGQVTLEGSDWWLRTEVSSLKGVGRFCMGLCNEVEVVDSPELEEYISSCLGTRQ